MNRRLIAKKSTFKSLVHFLFLLFMFGVMAHKRGYGFDAIYSRFSFVLLVAGFVLYAITNRDSLKTYVNSFFIAEILFVFLYFASFLWAKNDSVLFDGGIINSFAQILGVSFIIEATTDDLDDCKRYLKIYLLSIFYMTVWLIVSTPVLAWGSERVGEQIGLNPNSIGVRCAVAFLLSLYFAGENGKFRKFYYIFAVIFAIVGLYSGSRKSFLILTIGFAIYFVFKTRGTKTLLRIVAVIAGIIGLLHLLMINEELYNIIGKRIENGFGVLMGWNTGSKDLSTIERKFYIGYAVSMFFNRPILGYGGNGFVGEMASIGYSHVAYSHCNYVEMLANLGIVGFISYYLTQIRMLVASVKLYKKSLGPVRNVVCLILSILITNLLVEYFIVSYYSVSMQTLLIIAFAFIRCLKRVKENAEIEKSICYD